MRAIGVVLVVLGVLAMAYGGITYTRREKVIDIGSLEASVDKKERIPISPIAGGIAVVAGLVLVFGGRRARTA
jgi:uncharacterized membrane protein YidH (DUF202 family)